MTIIAETWDKAKQATGSEDPDVVMARYREIRHAEILNERAALEPDVRAEIENIELEPSNNPLKERGQELLLDDRENKLFDWAMDNVRRRKEREREANEVERDTIRATLSQQWEQLLDEHVWLGMFQEKFNGAVALLDQGRDAQAITALERMKVPAGYNPTTGEIEPELTQEEITIFKSIQTQFIAGIQSLSSP